MLTAYHCVSGISTMGQEEDLTLVLGALCLIPPTREPWKPKYGQRIKAKKGGRAKCLILGLQGPLGTS